MTGDAAHTRVSALLDRDVAATAAGIRLVSAQHGAAVIEMEALPTMGNGHAIVHGGWLFLLADTAAAYALATHSDEGVTLSGDIVFHAPTRVGATLTARATESHRAGANGLYDVVVEDSDAQRVASARFVGRSRQRDVTVAS